MTAKKKSVVSRNTTAKSDAAANRDEEAARAHAEHRRIRDDERLRMIADISQNLSIGVRETLRDFSGEYDRGVSDAVLEAVADGLRLRDACLAVGVRRGHVRRWIMENTDGMEARYQTALRMQAEMFVDDVLEIADNASFLDVSVSKLRIQARQWLMSKNSLRFSDKSTVTLEGNPDRPLRTVGREMTPQEAAQAWQETVGRNG